MSSASPDAVFKPFIAWPVVAPEDSTVFLYPSDLTPLGGPDCGAHFKTINDQLKTPDAATAPEVEAAGEARARILPAVCGQTFSATGRLFVGGPRMSITGEARLRLRADPPAEPDRTARGLFCRADRGRAVSITLRSVSGPKEDVNKKSVFDAAPDFPTGITADLFKPKFEPSTDRNPPGKPFWFSVADQVEVLYRAIFGTGDAVRNPSQGLVVVTGATNSAKSQITLGLIHKYLADRKAYGSRRPHLVTFEDPIEAFLYAPRDAEKLPGAGNPPELAELCGRLRPYSKKPLATAADCHQLLADLPRPLVAQWHGYDYTPREKGNDVRDLAQGFGDALRQTPAVYFVGEVRDVKDWAAVLDFAGTGHLVITTAHAGSLLEAMIKILTAVGADTAADRRRYAARIKAVVHLKPWMATQKYESPLAYGPLWANLAPDFFAGCANLLLPGVWRFTEPGLAALSTNGFGAVVPECPPANDLRKSCLGRQWFARELCAEVERGTGGRLSGWTRPAAKATGFGWSLTSDEVETIGRTMKRWAAKADLNRE